MFYDWFFVIFNPLGVWVFGCGSSLFRLIYSIVEQYCIIITSMSANMNCRIVGGSVPHNESNQMGSEYIWCGGCGLGKWDGECGMEMMDGL